MSVDELVERTSLLRWLQNMPRLESQLNEPFESDCELIQLDDNKALALTTDTLSEEIAMRLYKDPYTMGFIAATASIADLAAVGARPLGLLFSTCWGENASDTFREQVARGFGDALRRAQTYLLGGDSSQGEDTVLTSTGVGVCQGPPVKRMGAKEGDVIVITGQSGIGPLLAYQLLLNIESEENIEALYRPTIDWETSRWLAQNASAMIDTSDGVLAAITTLCALNGVGASLFWNEDVLDEKARALCHQFQIPLWALWVAEHGDYQLLAVIAREKMARVQTPHYHVIGEITHKDTLELVMGDQKRAIDSSWSQLLALTPKSEYSVRCRMLIRELTDLRFP